MSRKNVRQSVIRKDLTLQTIYDNKNGTTHNETKINEDEDLLHTLRKNGIQETITRNKKNHVRAHFLQERNDINIPSKLKKDNLSILHPNNDQGRSMSTSSQSGELKIIGDTCSKNSQYICFDIDYKFHENLEKIDNIGLSISLSVESCNNTVYCLICNEYMPQGVQILYKHICTEEHILQLSQLQKDNNNPIGDTQYLNKLILAQECIVRRSSNKPSECLLCNIEVGTDEKLIGDHIASSKHKNQKQTWMQTRKDVLNIIHTRFHSYGNTVQKYCCELCNYKGSSEIFFAKHLHVPYHKDQLEQIIDHAKYFKFHFCVACATLWFGSLETFISHCDQIEHRYTIKYGLNILSSLPMSIISSLIEPQQDVNVLLDLSNSTGYEYMTNNDILKHLKLEVRKFFPNVEAYPFGSRVSGLGFPNSDLDVFLDCDNTYDGKESNSCTCQKVISLVVGSLACNKTMWKVQEVILHCRIPIVKVLYIPLNLNCDISVTNGLGVENTKLIKCFNDVFPPCRKMILFLKQWLFQSNLLGSSSMTSYTIAWCVIFYLQIVSIFPSIKRLISLHNESHLINGWEVGVSYNIQVEETNLTFEELLLGFFIFYAEFNYTNYIVCPLLGQPLEKKAILQFSNLPPSMAPYIAYMKKTEQCTPFFIAPMCVQDPFDLSHNITKLLSKHVLKTFKSNCAYSAEILTKTYPHLNLP